MAFFSKYKKELELIKENIKYSQQLARIGSWTYDIEKNETYFTDEVHRILEINREELGNRLNNFLLFVHPYDMEIVKEAIRKAEKGEEYEIEYRIKTPNGKVKFIHEKTITIYAKDGKPVKTIGVIQDITERKLIENNLRELGENLKLAQRIAGIGSWKYDAVNNKFYVSEEMFNIFNINPQDFPDDYDSVLKLIKRDDRNKVQEALREILEGHTYSLEFRIPYKDGTEKYIIGRGEPIFDKDGQVVAAIGTLQDITENKLLLKELECKQAELEKSQTKFQVLIQESNDVFEIIAPDGTIMYISDASEKVLGYKPEERIGRKIYEFYDEEERKKVEKMISFVLNDESKKFRGEVVFTTKSGKKITLEVNLQNLLHEPAIEGIIVNFRDITARMEMEKRIIYLSYHDELTGLPNNRYFRERLRLQCQHADETNTKFGLFMLDIDGIVHIHDFLGHDYVDRLIIEIVKKMKEFLGEDAFISRYTDDHFAIFISGLKTYEEYEKIAAGLTNLFIYPFKIDK